MRTPRTPIPARIAAEIDEIRRREQLQAVEEAAGCWEDESHPELADGSEAWIRQMRLESELRLQRLQQQQAD
jgi:hypothetical protein